MLIGFSVKNYKTFYGECNLSMLAGSGAEYEGFNTFQDEDEKGLKSVLIYGANSNGKTNLISAMQLLKKIMVSDFSKQKELLSECEPFIFNEKSAKEAVEFEVEFKTNNILYTYGFHVLHGKVVKEYLLKKKKRTVTIFERKSSSYKDIKAGKNLFNGELRLIDMVREDILFIKFAYMLNNKISKEVVDYFATWLSDKDAEFPYRLIDTESGEMHDDALRLMKYADKSIKTLKLHTEDKKKELLLGRYFYSENWKPTAIVDVEFKRFSSSGSNHLYRILRNVFYVLDTGGVFIVDEIHNHLHPLLTKSIVEMFNSIKYNSRNAQLICTVHDVYLINSEIRRDQLWFIDKDECGRSSLYSLADFKNIRKDSDILKKYLLGVYGAIPNIDDLD